MGVQVNLYSTADLCRAAGVTPQQVSYDVKGNRLTAERVGRSFVFTQQQYDSALEFYRRRQAPPGEGTG